MNSAVKNNAFAPAIFGVSEGDFEAFALELFQFQYANNPVYRSYCSLVKTDAAKVTQIDRIPFLPISFFKTHPVVTTPFEPQVIFESSGTTQAKSSRHYVKELAVYEQSFTRAFRMFYGEPRDWCIIALLPSYLERSHSSLVLMADRLIRETGHPQSGFYLDEFEKLHAALQQLEEQQQNTLLIGVGFALLDFAALYPLPLRYTTVMETGGMKGRKEEITRQQLHTTLKEQFQLKDIHSEYGMTELLSQAYSKGSGLFHCPPWMKVLVREEDDPFSINSNIDHPVSGAVNIIDLANIYSAAFIATDDAGRCYPDGSFEVLGRLDNSDIRGCSLLAV